MNEHTEMKVTYIDPDQRALYVAELPDGGFGAWTQKGQDAPRKLVSKGYLDPDGYATFEGAQEALSLHVVNKKHSGGYSGHWDIFVNGKRATENEYHAMCRGELPVPAAMPPASAVTLANIEYRIATHIQGAYENLLQVGHCLNEAKESGLVLHGEWEEWVRANTNMSERQAQKLMQAARSVTPGSAMERLPISKIQAILALPEGEREPMAEKAAKGDMSLRELQKAVKEKNQAEEYAQKLKGKLEGVERDAKIYLGNYNAIAASRERDIANAEQLAREAAQAEIDGLTRRLNEQQITVGQLRRELTAAQEAPGESEEMNKETQALIDRLKEELAEAEEYAARQAEERKKAQNDMLAMQSQAARGEMSGAADGMTAFDLAAAVRTFIGSAGVLPHMGVTLSQSSDAERQQIRQHIDMVAAWVDGSRQAMGVIVVDGGDA